jgi:predicted aldo/keto reductase-like oxidoreductase
MVHYAIDNGVNYLDIDYPYDDGQREDLYRCISRALKNGYREKIKLTTSLPCILIKSATDFQVFLETALKLLGIEKIDFFLIGGINRQNWPKLPVKELLQTSETAVVNGQLGHLGFSFHDDFQTLRTVLDAYDSWSLCQFQYSFMDVDHHPGMGGLKLAAEKGLAVVVSEPLKRGRLTRNIPAPVAELWSKATPGCSPTEWGLLWVWNHPEVSTVVVDMSTMEQIKADIELADRAKADSFSVNDELLINQVRDVYRNLRPISCTACRGCMPCPQDVDAPRIFELYNDVIMYGDKVIPRLIFRDEGHDITRCNQCGLCVKACGRKIPIIDWLKKAEEWLVDKA